MGCKSTCCLAVGLGKSKLAINRIVKMLEKKPKARIVFTGARIIYLENFKFELKKFGHEDLISKIVFCCVKSLKNYIHNEIDLFIWDESHLHVAAGLEFMINTKNNSPKCEILCLTGTPFSETTETGRIMYSIAPISYSKPIDESIESKIINDYRITIIRHDLDNLDKYIKSRNFVQTETEKYKYLYKQYVRSIGVSRKKFPFELVQLKLFFKNLRSKEIITDYLLEYIKEKCLVYAGSIEQAESLGYPTYHSQMNKDDRKKNFNDFHGDLITKLINVNGLRESVSIPNLSKGIVMAPDASQNGFEQICGRFCRLVVGEVAHLIVLCARGTIEETWLNKAVLKLDSTKIKRISYEDFYKRTNNQ